MTYKQKLKEARERVRVVLDWLEEQDDNCPAYPSSESIIEFGEKYVHDILEKLMKDSFNKKKYKEILDWLENKEAIQKRMKVKCKLLTKGAKMPTKAHATDAGYDLYVSRISIPAYNEEVGAMTLECHSDVAFEIPEGYVGLVFPRSSISNTGLILTNSVGVIDSGYRGEVMAKFKILNRKVHIYNLGDRFAQLIIMPIPEIEFVEVDELSDSDRGTGGYGSSGK